MSGMTIVTYGGVEVLENIFEGISVLFLKTDNTFYLYSFLAALLGGFFVIVKAFFSQKFDLLKGYFFPLLLFFILLVNVKTNVFIEDRLIVNGGSTGVEKTSATVNNVPFLVGIMAKAISTIGYKITVAVERVMHVPNDKAYTKSGMIFGAESVLDMTSMHIQDAQTDSNLRKFCQTCVLYDLGLGLYTIEDLKKSDNLLQFLKNNTSEIRMMYYIPSKRKEGLPSSTDSQEVIPPKGDVITCCKAISEIAKDLEIDGVELKHQEKKEVFKRLPLYLHALSGVGKNNQELIQQSLVMSVLMDENASRSFAARRAAAQQKSTYQTIGAQAGNSLVWMRIVFEALIYASAIFVIPLVFLPNGVKYLLNWLFLTVWIQLWPPFYTILQYIMAITASTTAKTYLVGASLPYTIYSITGLEEIYSNTSALAGYLSLSIPFLSYSILQGGVGSLVHLAGSIMSPVHSAGAAASSEESSANYSFGNRSLDTLAYSNTSGFQQTLAPSLSHGFIREQNQNRDVIWGNDKFINKEHISSNAISLSGDHSLSSSMQEQLQEARTSHESITESYNESLSLVERNSESFQEHMSKDLSFSKGSSTKEGYDASESMSWLTNTVNSFADNHNCTSREAWSLFASPSYLGLGGSTERSWASEESWQEAKTLSESEDFKFHMQRVQDYAENTSMNEAHGEGERLMIDFSNSLDQLKSSSEQYATSFDHLNQVSNTASFIENASISDRHTFDQKFNEFLTEKLGSANEVFNILDKPYSPEMQGYIKKFWEENAFHLLETDIHLPQNLIDPNTHHSFKSVSPTDLSNQFDNQSVQNTKDQFIDKQFHERISEDLNKGKSFADISKIEISSGKSSLSQDNDEFISNTTSSANWSLWRDMYDVGVTLGPYMVHYDDTGTLFEDD